jgi:putative transposase
MMEMVGVSCLEHLQQACREQAEAAIEPKQLGRQSHWSESIAVGCSAYVEALKQQLGPRAKGRDILAVEGAHQLRETKAAYQGIFEGEKGGLRLENRWFWNLSLKH